MKKLMMTGPKTSVLIDVPIPEPGIGELLVKVKYNGVCMSEHYDWQTAQSGRFFGHEPVGHVVKLGKGATGFKEGDRVTGLSLESFAEYAIFKVENTVLVPDGVSDEDAPGEPISCLVSAVSKLPVQVPGDMVAVVGAGYMGLGIISLLKVKGAGRIIAVDVREEALANALRYGATEAYLPNQIPKEYLAPMSDIYSGGINVVTEWAGNDEALKIAGEMTKIDGILGIGAYHTGGNRSVDVQLWNVKAISAVSTHERKDDFQIRCCRQGLEMLASGQWDFTNLNTRIYALNEFDKAHADAETKPGNMIKALIDCTKW